MSEKIDYDTFKQVEIQIGKILTVEKVEGADKLLKLSVDLGEEEPRQIVSGIAPYYEDISVLEGRKCPFVTNLEPREIFGLESNGMIFAARDEENRFSLLLPEDSDISVGTLLT